MKRSQSLGALLAALVFTAPAVSPALTSLASVLAPTPLELRQQALEDRSSLNIERRAYTKIVEACAVQAMTNSAVVCPDINDIAGIQAFVRGESPTHAAAPASSSASSASVSSAAASSVSSATPVLTLDDISDGDLSLLRRYRNLQQCPVGLKTGKQAGFYEFCVQFIASGPRKTLKSIQLQRIVNLRIRALTKQHMSSSAPTLNDRLNALPKGIRPDR